MSVREILFLMSGRDRTLYVAQRAESRYKREGDRGGSPGGDAGDPEVKGPLRKDLVPASGSTRPNRNRWGSNVRDVLMLHLDYVSSMKSPTRPGSCRKYSPSCHLGGRSSSPNRSMRFPLMSLMRPSRWQHQWDFAGLALHSFYGAGLHCSERMGLICLVIPNKRSKTGRYLPQGLGILSRRN